MVSGTAPHQQHSGSVSVQMHGSKTDSQLSTSVLLCGPEEAGGGNVFSAGQLGIFVLLQQPKVGFSYPSHLLELSILSNLNPIYI